jgi:ferritin-like metal-binding protein YciE/iron-sulfur cluster repair protein YtfE (RIC family)
MGYFDWCESAQEPREKSMAARWLCVALRAHMMIEEEIFYPAARDALKDDSIIDHAYQEHAEAKQLVDKIVEELPANAVSDVLVRKLRETVEHHVKEEEGNLFPRLRATAMDVYALGRSIAAFKVDSLYHLTGRTRGTELQERNMTAISQDVARELFIAGLRNAHASARNGKEMVERQIERLERFPNVKARLAGHLNEKDMQLKRLEGMLDSLGEDRSVVKDAAMAFAGNMSAMMNTMADDEILKNSMTCFAMANFEAAAFESLIVMGEACGQSPEMLRDIQTSLGEERAMAAWLAENLRGVTRMHLQMRSEGARADR